MTFDYKKEYKEIYLPKCKPAIIKIPFMQYIAVRGQGNPNDEISKYKATIEILYMVAYTIKMSKNGNRAIEGYFDYVVPPLEGFWWQAGVKGVNYRKKEKFHWISAIRLPDFVRKEDVEWAKAEAVKKKKYDVSAVDVLSVEEGLCVQMMHIGSFDEESSSIAVMDHYLEENGYENDFSDTRMHHEIYLSDPRRVAKEKWKTVIRHPVKPIEEFKRS